MLHGVIGAADEVFQGELRAARGATHADFMAGTFDMQRRAASGTGQRGFSVSGSEKGHGSLDLLKKYRTGSPPMGLPAGISGPKRQALKSYDPGRRADSRPAVREETAFSRFSAAVRSGRPLPRPPVGYFPYQTALIGLAPDEGRDLEIIFIIDEVIVHCDVLIPCA